MAPFRVFPLLSSSFGQLRVYEPHSVEAQHAVTLTLEQSRAESSSGAFEVFLRLHEMAQEPWAWTRFTQGVAAALLRAEVVGAAVGFGRIDARLEVTSEGPACEVVLHAPVAVGWGLCQDEFALHATAAKAVDEYVEQALELFEQALTEAGPTTLPLCAFEGDWSEGLQQVQRMLAQRFLARALGRSSLHRAALRLEGGAAQVSQDCALAA